MLTDSQPSSEQGFRRASKRRIQILIVTLFQFLLIGSLPRRILEFLLCYDLSPVIEGRLLPGEGNDERGGREGAHAATVLED